MKSFFSLLFISLLFYANAQNKYWVTYNNKDASLYNINEPEEFLSEKALARRSKYNIAIEKTDLPVCEKYISTIKNLGVEIKNSSKWLNGTVVIIDDTLLVQKIQNLEFVKNIIPLSSDNNKIVKSKFNNQIVEINYKELTTEYGAGLNQIQMLKGDSLHYMSYKGEGIEIAVMDNGFPGVDTNKYYQKAFQDGRILKGYDFVNDNDTVFDGGNGNHGNYVISTMVSDEEGKMVGTAPDAIYYLFSTEDNANEGIAEEINWAMAAEMADNLMGIHAIISTSLGYSNGFNNGTNHTYTDMDGNTTPITIAADLAAKKGFLVVNSAGNSGANDWHYITAPSDGDSVLCIGAVDRNDTITNFSSRGPSYDGDVKPNVCAQGKDAAGISVDEKIVYISGTSFSCPITAGMSACLWQAFPDKSNMEIFRAIEKSAHLYANPNDDYGYGIPNFHIAYLLLKRSNDEGEQIIIMPNPVDDALNIVFKYETEENLNINITNSSGKLIASKSFVKDEFLNFYNIGNLANLSKGVYFIQVQYGKKMVKSKFLKN